MRWIWTIRRRQLTWFNLGRAEIEQRSIVHTARGSAEWSHGMEIDFWPNAKPSYERNDKEPTDRTRVYNTLNSSTSPECWWTGREEPLSASPTAAMKNRTCHLKIGLSMGRQHGRDISLKTRGNYAETLIAGFSSASFWNLKSLRRV